MPLDLTVLNKKAKAMRDRLPVAVVIDGKPGTGEPQVASSERLLAMYGANVRIMGSVRLVVSEWAVVPIPGKYITVSGKRWKITGTEPDATALTVRIDYESPR
jgi:hypothetical protein